MGAGLDGDETWTSDAGTAFGGNDTGTSVRTTVGVVFCGILDSSLTGKAPESVIRISLHSRPLNHILPHLYSPSRRIRPL